MMRVWVLTALDAHEAIIRQAFGCSVLLFDAMPYVHMVMFAGYGIAAAYFIQPEHQLNAVCAEPMHTPQMFFRMEETTIKDAPVQALPVLAPAEAQTGKQTRKQKRKQTVKPAEQTGKQTALDFLLARGNDKISVRALATQANVSTDAAWKAKREYKAAYLRQTKTGDKVQ